MAEARALRVLLANHVGGISGAEMSLLTLARHLDRRRFVPVAAVPPGPLATELTRMGVPVGLMPELRLARPRNPWQTLVRGLRMRQWATKLQIAAEEMACELVAANSLTAGLAAVMGVGGRLPVVWHARDLRAPDRAVRWLAPRVTRISAISRCVADAILAVRPDVGGRIRVIYNGVDTGRFRPTRFREEVRAEFGVPVDATVIATVGQLVPWKRQDLFLEAAARILARTSQAWFLVVGADIFGEHAEYVMHLRRMVADLELRERVVFTGYREDIASIMAATDLLLHPAMDEPLGRVVMEAMSLGVPCIAADSCGPAEIIEDGISGILTPPGDAETMAARAVELLGHPDQAHRIGEAAGRRIAEGFSAEGMARQTEDLYESALLGSPS